MTSIKFLEFLLFILLHQVSSEEAEPVFRAEGTVIEMGYCFGVDYIVVYRSAPEGDQLLGNSSADNTPITPPADLQDRININKHQHLLGLQISDLTHMDSGIYRRECWQNHTLISQHTQKLSVCDEEVDSEEIIVNEQDGQTELLCNSTSIGLEGTSVHWYHEMYPSYELTLFLDSSVSLDPLVKELQGLAEVRDGGALLLLDNNLLKMNQQFYCIVIKGKNCLSFQNMYLPSHSESRDMFASKGDRVVLNCPFLGDNQLWETPLGIFNGSRLKNHHMYISFDVKSEDFSLVIPAVSDEHSGDYSCISTFLEIQYSLILCPKNESQEKVVFEGGDLLLSCDVVEGDFQRVQWYRREPSGEYELIHDSKDETVPVPEDLMDRLTLSENSSSLKISHLEGKDLGVYWCIVLEGPQLLEGEGDGNDDDDDDDDYAEEEDYPEGYNGKDDQYWDDTHRCIFKKEIILSSVKKGRIDVDSKPVTVKTVTKNRENNTTAAPNVDVYGVGLGVGLVCLVVVVIVAVIVIKRRAKASPKQRKTASHSGHTTDDIKMNVDPDSTRRLTHNDEYGA